MVRNTEGGVREGKGRVGDLSSPTSRINIIGAFSVLSLACLAGVLPGDTPEATTKRPLGFPLRSLGPSITAQPSRAELCLLA